MELVGCSYWAWFMLSDFIIKNIPCKVIKSLAIVIATLQHLSGKICACNNFLENFYFHLKLYLFIDQISPMFVSSRMITVRLVSLMHVYEYMLKREKTNWTMRLFTNLTANEMIENTFEGSHDGSCLDDEGSARQTYQRMWEEKVSFPAFQKQSGKRRVLINIQKKKLCSCKETETNSGSEKYHVCWPYRKKSFFCFGVFFSLENNWIWTRAELDSYDI